MMIKITEHCTMQCSHCLNSATANNRHMSIETLRETMSFLKKHNIGKVIIVSGGEPTEHPEFNKMMREFFKFNEENLHYFIAITVTTNGEHIPEDPEMYKQLIKDAKAVGIELVFQVSADVRYYPRRVPLHKRIFREPGFIVCDNCIEQIYPIGRALENNIPSKSKASSCFNARSILHQLLMKRDGYYNGILHDLENTMIANGKMCTPHIGVDGWIKLGESDHCPICTSIREPEETICRQINWFTCRRCKQNETLPYPYKTLLNPVWGR